MPRPRVHSADSILDATRDLICAGGVAAASSAAISAASGAPSGSVYHQFGSRGHLLARLWIRTVRRFQAGFVAAAATGHGVDRVVAAALWVVDFAAANPADARLLMQFRREDLVADDPGMEQELAELNRPVVGLVRELCTEVFGDTSALHLELTTVALIDVPYGVVTRGFGRGVGVDTQRAVVEAASRAVLV